MEWIETTGRSLDEAKETALERLGVAPDDVEFQVVDEAKLGLFGRVKTEARVRARVRPQQPPPKEGRRRRREGDRRRRRSRPGRDDKGGDGKSREAKGGDRGAKQGSGPKGERGGQARRGRGGKQHDAERKPAEARNDDRRREAASMTETSTVEEQAEVVESFLDGLLDAFALDADVAREQTDEDTITVKVEGDALGLLIGPKGATLRAIQDLARTVVQRRCEGRHEGRVRVDVGGYWERRRGALEAFTRRLADEVRESGVQKALEPMGAADRKVVHDAAVEIEGVRTVSEGEDPQRRVVLIPDDGS